MSFYARWIVIFWSLGVAVAQAEQLHVQIFYDDAPLKGVEVVVDGAPLGTTNARGLLSGDVQAGARNIQLVDDQFALPLDIDMISGEEGELAITFTSAEGDGPEISFDTFASDEQGSLGVLVGRITDSSGAPLSSARVAVNGGVSLAR